MVLFLHGSGAAGNDIARVRHDGLPRRLEEKGALPFVVIAPQSPTGGWDVNALNSVLDRILESYRVDQERVYLTGLSMGGYGAWQMGAMHPERFAAIAPICGGGDVRWGKSLSRAPIWAFHGDQDKVTPPSESIAMVEAVRRAGGDVKFTVYKGVGHNAWTRTYDDPAFYSWLLSHRRHPP